MSWRTRRNNQLCFSTFSLFLLFLMVPALGLNLDGSLLLSFKYSILSDPLSVLDNWDYNDITPCLWTGVTCAQVETSTGAPDMFRVISLVLPNSKLFGTIPEDLGFIQHLQTLDLSKNFLIGTLPTSIFNASELEVLSLSNNSISGGLQEFTVGGNSLKVLNLSKNALVGNVPKSLTSLKNLTVVSLRSNYFSGLIPGGVQYIEVLDFSSNLFKGSLPVEFGGENLRYLNLSSNKLSGVVPSDFAKKIPANSTIDLSFNSLTGEIPESKALSNQKTDSYAGNIDLCGKPLKKLCTVPSTLSNPPNVSTNTSPPAIAAIPKTIGSTPLPDSPGTTSTAAQDPPQHGLKPGAIAGIAFGDLAGIGVLAIVLLYVYQLKKKKKADSAHKETPEVSVHQFKKNSEPPVEKEARNFSTWLCLSIQNGEETSEATGSDSDDYNDRHCHAIDDQVDNEKQQAEEKKNQRSLVMVDGETELEFETLLKASAYILGSSSASIVYKAVLQDGTSFAVRRIGESGVKKLKEFENLVKIIAKLRHPNLVLVRGFYWGDVEKLVIYDFLCNGSLANVGFRKTGSSPYHLPFKIRLKIAKGVARGLTYIHEKKHVHGNIKPSNILLTAEMEPVISDLGIHWLIYGKRSLKSDSSARHYGSKRSTSSHDNVHDHQSINGSPSIAPVVFVGCTSPYHAPESHKNLKPNPKWDVYSFGILLLELITGKVFSDRELSQWTSDSVVQDPNWVLRMADMAIRGDVAIQEEAMLSLFKLGFSCASLVPKKRPSMKDALHVLEKMP
ncbi:probable LRR receptor-like serine/threonine-protein kinase At4g37250 [Olea europaea var. sylvestris]|uniref:probable LRR receptor-like serine/threonine-protein kinase At4g37250 n=1 Tax=Olea europaea var. sylvestris TaxID=158386 RepID=UPI000C1CF5BC|nr:probable LRR receptor-like serine/threonine-protein kinase At4g37250 [Olea europaea var. sylvestris]